MVEPEWCSNSGFLDKAGKCRNPDGCACAAIAQLERDLAEARAETVRAKAIIAKACNHLPNGAFCSPEASLDFMERVPDEVLIVTSGLVNKITAAEAERDGLAAEVERLRALLGDFVGHDLSYDGGNIVVPIGNHNSAIALVRRARASLQTGEKGE